MGFIARALTGWKESARANGIREREITMMADGIAPRLGSVSRASRPD